MMSGPFSVYGSATNENRRMAKKVGKVGMKKKIKIVYHRKGCMSHDIITKYMNWIAILLGLCIHERKEEICADLDTLTFTK